MLLDQIDALTRQIDQLPAVARLDEITGRGAIAASASASAIARSASAIARSILVIIFHLPAGPAARFRDLGSGHYDERVSAERKIRSHVRQLEALGLTVTLTPAGDAA